MVRPIDRGYITPPQRLQHFGEAGGLVWRHEPVDMMGHQHRGGHGGGVLRRGLLETHQGEAIIVRMQEERLTLRPALDDMLRDAREDIAGWSGPRQPPDRGHWRG